MGQVSHRCGTMGHVSYLHTSVDLIGGVGNHDAAGILLATVHAQMGRA